MGLFLCFLGYSGILPSRASKHVHQLLKYQVVFKHRKHPEHWAICFATAASCCGKDYTAEIPSQAWQHGGVFVALRGCLSAGRFDGAHQVALKGSPLNM